MRRWVMVALVMLVLVFVAGIILVTVQRNRLAADRLQCQYRFEQLGQFAGRPPFVAFDLAQRRDRAACALGQLLAGQVERLASLADPGAE